jgi:Cu-Zn family superoxide dismutase
MTTRSISGAVVTVCLLAMSSWSCGGTESSACATAACGACAGAACATTELRAKGKLVGKEGSGVSGMVEIIQGDGPAHVIVAVEGASPGLHGVHVHAVGDCSAPDFSSAGPHFNPTGAAHACPPTEPRHAGDLGNISIGADGRGLMEMSAPDITLGSGSTSVMGLAVILHDGEDDCSSQPAGDSGMRLACAVLAPLTPE